MEMVEEGEIQVKFSPNLIKLQEIVEKEEEVDRISALPDSLLVEILSLLPSTKDAIITGTLSKRWKNIWNWLPVLIFRQNPNPASLLLDNHPLSDFVTFVDKTLTQCRHLKLEYFGLSTSYDVQFESQFKNWIHYAISCNVEVLGIYIRNCRAYLFDQNFFTTSCFMELRLSGCLLNPIGAISWKNLTSLRISYVNVDEDLIENILSGSPQLETLELVGCYGFSLLNITTKSVKNLVFSKYQSKVEYRQVGHIVKINAPNILSLTIKDDLELHKLLLLNVSSVVEANLDYFKLGHFETAREEMEEEMLKGLILNLRHVKELIIGFFCSKVLSRLEAKGFVFPSNVKFTEVTYDWSENESGSENECESENDSVENED